MRVRVMFPERRNARLGGRRNGWKGPDRLKKIIYKRLLGDGGRRHESSGPKALLLSWDSPKNCKLPEEEGSREGGNS